ncbi:geranylgeranyl transferas-like protein type i beta subunit [Teratosphaeria nubilosa]|uniref:Geranylgeranyl transferas-like protein type i beta subunit n=1 Tax=Teratosphaeria nubilosa TaxID=161662 RepID=A0A6G1L8S4_9PEZI|nr:geranylgeranyl transferas-like protein type i beta subunit [Teratosphaeria nubilosa]
MAVTAVSLDDESGLLPPLKLEKARHVKYWTRCLKTLLPHQYTSNDSNRMYLAYFIISALDLLGVLGTVPSEQERRDHIDWVYHCQHPHGGFRMWPGTDFGDQRNESNAQWDPANVPATYFALALLLIYNDDLQRVRREGTLQWLAQMQRPDGSFGETLVNGQIEGGRDPRFGYCAAGIRYMLRGDSASSLDIAGQQVPDINVDGLVRCMCAAECHDGGLADEPFHEPHAGYTFCSIGALALVQRLRLGEAGSNGDEICGPSSPANTIGWLISRQTELTDPNAGLDSEFSGSPKPSTQIAEGKMYDKENGRPPAHQARVDSAAGSIFDLLVDGAGMNGRCNKVADTCYAFWACAPLHIMKQPNLYDHQAIRRYLLGKTQHPVLGGFGKFPGDLPDLYHSYLGLAALSLAGDKDVKELDGGMCLSKEARAKLPGIWEKWRTTAQ